MAIRVQVVLAATEREAFRMQAEREGLSLSAWLRVAARERLASQRSRQRIVNKADLEAFFAACDEREEGEEPDWEDHLQVIRSSQTSGAVDL